MKKLTFLLSLMITLGGLNAHAQGGTIQFQNSFSSPVLIDPGLGTTYVIGTSNAASFGAGPGQVNVQMYVALASAPNQFFLAGTTTNSGSTSSLFLGTFHGGSPYSIPSTLDGGAFIQGAVIDYFFAAETQSGFSGTSATGTGYVLAGGSSTPGLTFGNGPGQISGFIIGVPEPSTIVITGLGAVAMLFYRWKRGSPSSL